MAYMPLHKDKLYLETEKMTKIWDLSQPWGWDTPLWPFPGARSDLNFPRGQYLERFHKRTNTYTGTLHAATHCDAPKRSTASVTATPSPRCVWSTPSAPASSST